MAGKHLFAFIGNDDLQRQEALEKAVATWLGEAAGDAMAKDIFFGEELDGDTVVEAYQTVSMFTVRKAIILHNIDKAALSHQKRMEASLKHPNGSVAVFAEAVKWDARSTFRKLFASVGTLKEFKSPYANQIPAWLSRRAKEAYGRRLDPPDAHFLWELVGNDLGELDRELQKMDTFLSKGDAITAKEIDELVSPQRVMDIFEFQNSMGLRESGFLPALRSLLDNGEAAFVLVSRLYTHFLTLLRIRALLDQGLQEKAVAERMGLNYFFLFQRQRYGNQALSRPQKAWMEALIQLARLEHDMKQGRCSHRFEVEMAFAGMI